MKKILVTMREGENNNTKTDNIDKRIIDFLEKCELDVILVPNNIYQAGNILKTNFDGVVLTGGDNIYSMGGNLCRDKIESLILKTAIKKNIPVIGICRGMQKIQDYFGISMQETPNNISNVQEILINNEIQIVNSFHDYGTFNDNDIFYTWAMGMDGVIKAIQHKELKISGIMWHPERISPPREYDLNYFMEFFK